MIRHVLDVVALPDLKLQLRFDTEEVRVFDVKPFLSRGRFAILSDQTIFRQARVAFGTVEWPQDLDLDPEDLYDLSIPLELFRP